MASRISYIKTYHPLAIKAGLKYGINPIVIMAQSAKESGWGDSTNVRKANNFFGITVGSKSNEYWKGKYRIAANGNKYRIYDTPLDCFMDFAKLIKEKYPNVAAHSDDVKKYAKSISQTKYISASDNKNLYERDLIGIAERVLFYLKTAIR